MTNVLAVVMTTLTSRECPPLCFFFCQIYCFSPRINVHSSNSLSTFNVCMAAVVTKVCVNSSSGDVLHRGGLTRRKEKHRRANLSRRRHLGEKVRYGCQFVLHVCVLRCERGECGRVRVRKLCSAFQHSVSVKAGVALLGLQTLGACVGPVNPPCTRHFPCSSRLVIYFLFTVNVQRCFRTSTG